MEMLNERAIRIIEEIPIETDEQKTALELSTEALKRYKCIELAPLDNKALYAFKQDQVLHIYCKDQEEMNKVIEIIKKGWGEKCQKI